ncbi:RICIN domain-containing protein [Streptomyces sp. NPDC052496]|uniref:RICIN domain-containing protein n=1 Tax=Streptomyces sp. NPDC052496 TaxID=3154951 RepID=UPI0034463B6C
MKILTKKKTGVISALVAAACMTVMAAQTPASAAGPAKAKTLTNWQTSYCLDGDAKGALYTSKNSNGCGYNNSYQQWNFHTGEHGVMLQSRKTGLCVTAGGSGSDRVSARACDSGDDRQWWTQEYLMDDVYLMINYQNKRALDSNMNGNVYTSIPSDSNSYMKWFIPS